MNIWITIKPYSSNKHCIYLPSSLCSQIKEDVILNIGLLKEKVRVKEQWGEKIDLTDSSYDKPIVIELSSHTIKRFDLPTNITYQLKVVNDEITIGPVIGILIYSRKYNKVKFKEIFYRTKMIIYKKIGGIVVAYTLNNIDWNNKKVTGMVYNPEMNNWEQRQVPFPKVTYKRIFSSGKLLKYLEDNDGILFNSTSYSKWKIQNILETNKKISQHIPKTIRVNNFKQVDKLFNKNNKFVLKPIDGFQGRGIYFLEKDSLNNNLFIIKKYEVKGKKIFIQTLNKKELALKLKQLNIYKKRYLLQEYIPLAKVKNKPFDFRVIMQKVKDETWQCTGIEARLANNKKEITNLSAGGSALDFDQVIARSDTLNTSQNLKQEMIALSKELCEWIDRNTKHTFAELGLDLAFDINGKIWIIEVNTRPGYSGFLKFSKETFKRISYRPLIYATYRQGFIALDDKDL